ncbi:hypothetical protein J421_4078 [Gemmatirosa kalamazoonensis]|uniref:Uncharacterized protein n=1 Tax=Gemmatirosa kalamazoonensis TaxID=861299 RepID=W0RMR0_9BACT|nr:hypothetical protein [Gemmatirosa kalamazoonensis]AHG91615.1 hypothetical protein J421_4078 [Gemmatirosa kalamazoonensis]
MLHDRREFLGQLVLGALPLSLAPALALAEPSAQPDMKWDLSWTDRIKGKYRAVFDVPEIDQGYGVWRASLWEQQYQQVLGVKPADLSSVLVLRHNGIALAMQQPFWDKHALGKANDVKHPLTQQATDRNPVLLTSSRNEVPAELDEVALDRFIKRGGIVLACNLALDDMVGKIAAREGGAVPALRQEAVASFVPGVILQPSGVFAALRAQDAGCKYLRAS